MLGVGQFGGVLAVFLLVALVLVARRVGDLFRLGLVFGRFLAGPILVLDLVFGDAEEGSAWRLLLARDAYGRT